MTPERRHRANAVAGRTLLVLKIVFVVLAIVAVWYVGKLLILVAVPLFWKVCNRFSFDLSPSRSPYHRR